MALPHESMVQTERIARKNDPSEPEPALADMATLVPTRRLGHATVSAQASGPDRGGSRNLNMGYEWMIHATSA